MLVILLCIGAWAVFPPANFTQNPAPADTASFVKAARRAIAHGQMVEAESMARARPADDPARATVLAQIAARSGKYADAMRLLEPAAAKDPAGDAALELALLQMQLGRAEDATRALNGIFRQSSSAADPEALFRAGRAAQALNRARDANALYRAAAAASDDPAIDTAWGLLFLEKYNAPEALRSLQDAIKADPEWAPAHAGLARLLAEENPPAGAASARKALEIDAGLADARLLLAELELDNSRQDAARQEIDKALELNPSNLQARSLIAAMAYLRGDKAAYDVEVKRILEINPAFGEVYRIVSHHAASNYRFDEAVALAKQAVSLDSTNSRAFADLGMHLLRTGDEPEARRALDRAFNADPFNVVTFNLLALLDKLDKFVVEKSGDLIVKFHPDEAAIMREYAIPLAHEALKTLTASYNFTPKGPILIEIFPVHDDFAVRNLGIPGMIAALGACFGRVVTMDSPKVSRPERPFAWQATLWHELAHVITLQMSNQRVPRWLTEGISVYEEGRARPEWGRDMEVPFALARERGEVLKLKDLNSGFTKPETIALAYYQSSLLVDHIVAAHGAPKLRALLTAYGEGLEGEAAVTKALGVSLDALQGTFDKALETRFAPMQAALKGGRPRAAAADAEGATGTIDALKAAAAAAPNSYSAQLALGQALAAAGDRAAFEALEKAAALVPVAPGEDSPHAIMGRLAAQLGDLPRAISEYTKLLAHDHASVEPARELASLAEKAKDEKASALAYDRIVALDPFDPQAHTGSGRLALKRGDALVATREFRAALLAGAGDKAAAHCDLGEAYLALGRFAEAKKEALSALEIAPTFERAQELLLRAVEKSEGKAER